MSAALKPQFNKYDLWARFRYFCMHTLLHADDTPHRLALGAAVGVWFALTPTVGIQIITIIPLAAIIRCNKAIALAMIWISNPITTVPIYLGGYWVGAKLLGHEFKMDLVYQMVGRVNDGSLFGAANNLGLWENLKIGMDIAFGDIMWPLWFGCLLVGTAVALPSYYIFKFIIIRHRMKRFGSVNIRATTKGIVIDEKEILLTNGQRVPWDAENKKPILDDEKAQTHQDDEDHEDEDQDPGDPTDHSPRSSENSQLKLTADQDTQRQASDSSVFAA